MGRNKKLRAGIESIREEIETHFDKLKKDLEKRDLDHARYHIKELDKSLIDSLERKIKILGGEDGKVVEEYRERLKELVEEFEG
jgi:hypothetical protein